MRPVGRGEGDHAAAGAQIGHATSGREPGFRHHIDEQLRVLLSNVNLLGGDNDVARVGVCGRHISPFRNR